jgi:predicted dehydrogenase
MCKVAIKSGKHVFIEKFSVEEAEEIIALANEYNVKGQVGHVERFNPAFIATKNMIETQCLLKHTVWLNLILVPMFL